MEFINPLLAYLTEALQRYVRRLEFYRVFAKGERPDELTVPLEPQQLTLALLDLRRATIGGSHARAREAFSLMVDRRSRDLRGAEWQLFRLPDEHLAIVFFGSAQDRLWLISGAVQEYDSTFPCTEPEGEPAIVYAVVSPLEAGYALRPLLKTKGGLYRVNDGLIAPDLATMMYHLGERRLWADALKDKFLLTALLTEGRQWLDWADISDLSIVEEIPESVRVAVTPVMVRDIMARPLAQRYAYLGELFERSVHHELQERLVAAKKAHDEGDLLVTRREHFQLFALQFLIISDLEGHEVVEVFP